MKNKTQTLRGLSEHEQEVLDREWGGFPVIEAQKELRLFVSKEDIEGSTRKDFGCCALAECCKRSFGSTGAFFYLQYAYVQLPTSGNVQRFQLSKEARQFVKDFDQGKVVASQEVSLMPPTRGNQLETKRGYDKADKKRKARGEVKTIAPKLKGTAKKVSTLSGKPIINSVVRSGRGQVNFTTGSATGKAAK